MREPDHSELEGLHSGKRSVSRARVPKQLQQDLQTSNMIHRCKLCAAYCWLGVLLQLCLALPYCSLLQFQKTSCWRTMNVPTMSLLFMRTARGTSADKLLRARHLRYFVDGTAVQRQTDATDLDYCNKASAV